ncbi:MAG: hypothetical protein WC608_01700 [Parcubacteria group bacterium]
MDDKYEYYYEAMESLSVGNIFKAKKLLKKSLLLDVEFIDGYNGFVAVSEDEENKKKAKEYSEIAFRLTREKFSKWPREMHWGDLDNRPYLRAICNKAIYFHEDGKKDEAEKLYRLLLKLNPCDSQGVRYLLAALFAGKHPKITSELIEKGNRLQDWSEIEKLVEVQNKKHKFWNNNI